MDKDITIVEMSNGTSVDDQNGEYNISNVEYHSFLVLWCA